MILLVASAIAMVLAAIPCVMFFRNLALYRRPGDVVDRDSAVAVSLLIPARDEADKIQSTLDAALQSQGVQLEIVVLDDHSSDDTARLVEATRTRDGRVRLARSEDLPPGWCGKQHACWQLAQLARYDTIAFVDADVRLEPDGLRRAVAFLDRSGASLVSGVPYQETKTCPEKLLIPLIHFVLLGFLPMRTMRRSRSPAYGAGCGQLFVTRRSPYDRAGGHAGIRETRHDGIRLPRAYRAAGLATDLFDATDVARCRMYRGARDLWSGLAKNATEGLAAPGMIIPATLLLFGGQVAPLVLLVTALVGGAETLASLVAGAATAASFAPRIGGVLRFRQSLLGAALHPIGITVFLVIQWYALARQLIGRPTTWKGRSQAAADR